MRKCVFCKTRYNKESKTSFHRFPSELSLRNRWLENMKALNWTPKEKDSLCSKHFDTKCFITHNTRTALKSGTFPTLFEGLFEISDQNFNEDLKKATDAKSYSNEIKIKEESQPADFTYPYKYATCTSSSSTSLVSSECQSSKQREVKRMLSESMDSSTPGNSNTDQRESIRCDYDYESSRTPNKTRIQYGVAHDHGYESSSRSSEKSLHRTKRSLQLSNARVKALTQRVKRLKIKVTHLKTVINDLSK